MVFIWGNKGYRDHVGYIIQECPACKKTVPFSVLQVRKKFTVYFVPTFSYSSKQFLECGACRAAFEVPDQMRPEVEKALISQQELSRLVAGLPDDAETDLPLIAAPDVKRCPYCAEEIQSAAVYCRYCKRDLPDEFEKVEYPIARPEWPILLARLHIRLGGARQGFVVGCSSTSDIDAETVVRAVDVATRGYQVGIIRPLILGGEHIAKADQEDFFEEIVDALSFGDEDECRAYYAKYWKADKNGETPTIGKLPERLFAKDAVTIAGGDVTTDGFNTGLRELDLEAATYSAVYRVLGDVKKVREFESRHALRAQRLRQAWNEPPSASDQALASTLARANNMPDNERAALAIMNKYHRLLGEAKIAFR